MLDERDIERVIRGYLRAHGWADYWPEHGTMADVCARKTADGAQFTLVLEAKGDVGPNVANPKAND